MTTALAALGRGATVVTATQRLARHLRARFDLQQHEAGLAVWPAADVLPWDAWLDRLWQPVALDGAAELLSADESRLLWRQVVGAGDAMGTDAGVLAALANRAWRICEDWHIGLRELQAAADTADSETFARWARAFRTRCEQAGRVDRGTAIAALAADLPPVAAAEICFAGFDPWPAGHALLAAALEKAGVRISHAGQVPVAGCVRRLRCDDDADEIRRAVAWARTEFAAAPELRIGIVVADLGERGTMVRRACLDAFSPGWQLHPPATRPVTVSLGRALARYPVIHAALLLLAVSGTTLSWQEAGQLLRSRYIGDGDSERDARIAADLILRRQYPDTLSPAEFLHLCQRHAPLLAERLERLLAAFGGTPAALPSRWARRVSEALDGCGWPGERDLDGDERQAVLGWQRLLAAFSAWDGLLGPLPFASVLAHLGALANDRVFEPAGDDGGLQVMGLLEAEGQNFDRLWICGLTAESWPPPAAPDPLLPMSLQRRCGLPDALPGSARERARRRFDRLSQSAPEVICSWPAMKGDETLEMSPWLAGADEFLPAHSSSGQFSPDRDVVARSGREEILSADPPPPLPTGVRLSGGTRLLNLQATCPARAFAEFRLGARQMDVPAPLLDARMRGNIVHELLERLYELPACRQGLGGLSDEALQVLFDGLVWQVLDRFVPRGERFLRSLRELERNRLWRLVLDLRRLDALRGEFSVETEKPREMQVGPLFIRVRLDRLESFPDGSQIIVDYKTGAFSAAGWYSARLAECQLPLYAISGDVSGIAVLRLQLPEARLTGIVGAAGLAVGGLKEVAALRKSGEPDWPALVARWRAQLGALAAEFAAGDFRVDPGSRRREAEGEFAALTRVYELGTVPGDEE